MIYTKENILAGRKLVENYRLAHSKLYLTDANRKTLPQEHAPLINKMMADFEALGFIPPTVMVESPEGLLPSKQLTPMDEFNTASELLNIQELGFTSFEDFEKRAKPRDYKLLDGKWH